MLAHWRGKRQRQPWPMPGVLITTGLQPQMHIDDQGRGMKKQNARF